MKIITIYTTPNCTYCKQAKAFLQDKPGYSVYEVDISTQPKIGIKVKAELGPTMPQIVIDRVHVGGYEELKEYFSNQ